MLQNRPPVQYSHKHSSTPAGVSKLDKTVLSDTVNKTRKSLTGECLTGLAPAPAEGQVNPILSGTFNPLDQAALATSPALKHRFENISNILQACQAG